MPSPETYSQPGVCSAGGAPGAARARARARHLAGFALWVLAGSAAASDLDADQAARRAAQALRDVPALSMDLQAIDHVSGKRFTARLLYDRDLGAAVVKDTGDFVSVRGGVVTVRDGERVRRFAAAEWLGAAGRALDGPYASLAAAAPAKGEAPRFGGLAEGLGVEVALDLRREGGDIVISLLVTPRFELSGDVSPTGLQFRFPADRQRATARLSGGAVVLSAGRREARFDPKTGAFLGAVLLSTSGRAEAEVEVVRAAVGEAARPVALPEAGEAKPVDEPPARVTDRLADQAVEEGIRRIRAAAAAGPVLGEGRPRLLAALTGYYAALFALIYPEAEVRAEARRATASEADAARGRLKDAGLKGRTEALDQLAEAFRRSCRRELRAPVQRLVELGEAAAAQESDASLRRGIVLLSSEAAIAAFEAAIVEPMADEARAALERLATSEGGG